MKYVLLIYSDEGCMTEPERQSCMIESLRVCDDLKAKGQFLDAAPLQPVATASTVRVRDGRMLVTDGPFAETVEQLGGFYVLDLPDLDAAISVASRLPPVVKGTVEIRPLSPLDDTPPPKSHTIADGVVPHLMLCYHSESSPVLANPDTLRDAKADAAARCRELAAAGEFFSASPLHPVATATCVRVRDGKRFITDGPFAETHEVLGGYYLIRVADRDAALAIAAQQPGARIGSIEVRQLFDLSSVRDSISNS
jgi:hypothetical protein